MGWFGVILTQDGDVAGAEFLTHPGGVPADSLVRDAEVLGDILVTAASRKLAENVALARGEDCQDACFARNVRGGGGLSGLGLGLRLGLGLEDFGE